MADLETEKLELVRIARLVLAKEIRPLMGAWLLNAARSDALMDWSVVREIAGICSVTDHIPLGPSREHYSAEYLARVDKDVPVQQILAACETIVREFADGD